MLEPQNLQINADYYLGCLIDHLRGSALIRVSNRLLGVQM